MVTTAVRPRELRGFTANSQTRLRRITITIKPNPAIKLNTAAGLGTAPTLVNIASAISTWPRAVGWMPSQNEYFDEWQFAAAAPQTSVTLVNPYANGLASPR